MQGRVENNRAGQGLWYLRTRMLTPLMMGWDEQRQCDLERMVRQMGKKHITGRALCLVR